MKARSDMINMSGQSIGRLQVVSLDDASRKWRCICSCGAMVLASGGNLRKGSVRSCGCLAREERAQKKTSHGLSDTPEYRVFLTMRARCTNPKAEKFPMYGGRGVEVRFKNFEDFIRHIGTRPSTRHSVDRIDNDGHYEPGNVRWATDQAQRNNRSDSELHELNGVKDTLTGFARRLGISASSMRSRIKNGWSVEAALSTPANARCQANGSRLRDRLAASIS